MSILGGIVFVAAAAAAGWFLASRPRLAGITMLVFIACVACSKVESGATANAACTLLFGGMLGAIPIVAYYAFPLPATKDP